MEQQINLTQPQKTTRNMWGEIFRIFCIVLILFTHFQSQNKLYEPRVDLARIGVFGFILISGFYSVNSTKGRTKKMLVKTVLLTIGAIILLGILFACKIPKVDNPFEVLFGGFVSDKYSSGGFLYVYLAFTLFQPLINKFIHKLDKGISLGIIIVFALCSIAGQEFCISSLPPIYFVLTFNQMFAFAGVYASAGGVSKYYGDHIKGLNTKNRICESSIGAILFVAFFVICGFTPQISSGLLEKHVKTIALYEIIVRYFASLSFFMFCMLLPKINSYKTNKCFSVLGESTLDLYLGHGSVGTLLDLVSFNMNLHLKFFLYFIIAAATAIVLHFFIQIQEKYVGILINKIKLHHQNKKSTTESSTN